MASVEQLQIGVKVRYFPLLKDKNRFTDHVVESDSWKISDETVVKVSGKAGGVSIKHLEIID